MEPIDFRLDLDYKPKMPVDRSQGIAIVGAGEIVEGAHLPAYGLAGFRIIGLYDINFNKASALAAKFGIPKVYRSLAEMLEDKQVQIVDVAIPAAHQYEAAQQIVSAGKHVLFQKPLAESYSSASKIEQLCTASPIKSAVNQQLRWAPGIRAARNIILEGLLGQLTQVTFQVNVNTDFTRWPFLADIDTLEIMYHSIHYIDSIRSILGTPDSVYADAPRYPGQKTVGESRSLIVLKFGDTVRGLVHDNHNNPVNESDWFAEFRIEGTEGVIRGTNGALYNKPHGREDTLTFCSNLIAPGLWLTPKLEGRRFPHAFMGSMGELMRAIEEDRDPENSVRDNLHTMRSVFAAYRSIQERREVALTEITEQ